MFAGSGGRGRRALPQLRPAPCRSRGVCRLPCPPPPRAPSPLRAAPRPRAPPAAVCRPPPRPRAPRAPPTAPRAPSTAPCAPPPPVPPPAPPRSPRCRPPLAARREGRLSAHPGPSWFNRGIGRSLSGRHRRRLGRIVERSLVSVAKSSLPTVLPTPCGGAISKRFQKSEQNHLHYLLTNRYGGGGILISCARGEGGRKRTFA